MAKFACLFPGQGSQTVGMGHDFFQQSKSAQKLFREIDEIAGRPLSKLCFEGPAEELKKTNKYAANNFGSLARRLDEL